MKQPKFNALLLIGLIGVFTAGISFAINLYRAFGGNQNIYWTARTMPLTMDETKNSFELFIHKKSIHDHLSDGTLHVVLENGDQKSIVSIVPPRKWPSISGSTKSPSASTPPKGKSPLSGSDGSGVSIKRPLMHVFVGDRAIETDRSKIKNF